MISVVVPVYNAEKYLENTIRSILAQTEKDLELLLIDDGSTDGSHAICRKFQETEKRVRVFHQENAGASVARNKGIDEAKGEWIAFVDADDELPKESLKVLLNRTIAYPNADVIVGVWDKDANKQFQDKSWIVDPKKLVSACLYPQKHYPLLVEGVEGVEGNICLGSPWGKLIKRETLRKNNLRFPEGAVLHEDTLFCVQLYLSSAEIILANDNVYRYFDTPNSVSVRYHPKRVENMCNVIELVCRSANLKASEFQEAVNGFVAYRIIDCIKGNFTNVNNRAKRKENKKILQECYERISGVYFQETGRRIESLKLSPIRGNEKLLLSLFRKKSFSMLLCICSVIKLIKRLVK